MEAGAHVVKAVDIAVRGGDACSPSLILGEDIVKVVAFAGIKEAVDGEDDALGAVLVDKGFAQGLILGGVNVHLVAACHHQVQLF